MFLLMAVIFSLSCSSEGEDEENDPWRQEHCTIEETESEGDGPLTSSICLDFVDLDSCELWKIMNGASIENEASIMYECSAGQYTDVRMSVSWDYGFDLSEDISGTYPVGSISNMSDGVFGLEVVLIDTDGEYYFLDATESTSSMEVTVELISSESVEMAGEPAVKDSMYVTFDVDAQYDDDGFVGAARSTFTIKHTEYSSR